MFRFTATRQYWVKTGFICHLFCFLSKSRLPKPNILKCACANLRAYARTCLFIWVHEYLTMFVRAYMHLPGNRK